MTGVEKGKATAVDPEGERRRFGRQRAGAFDACEQRRINLAIGDRVLMRAGVRNAKGNFVNGERLTVAGWDEQGNPTASDGRSITGRNLALRVGGHQARVRGSDGTQSNHRL